MTRQRKIISRAELSNFFFEDPISKKLSERLGDFFFDYFYFDDEITITTGQKEVINACLLKGDIKIIHNDEIHNLNQFDFLFLPPKTTIKLVSEEKKCKICVVKTPIETNEINFDVKFEIQKFNLNKFIDRGELSDNNKMSTFRTVWTAFKNGYFMSGFTNIPNKALNQGVVTSVNLEETAHGTVEIYPHIHHDFPEVYIFCISDNTTAVTQYLINEKGESIAMERFDGEGLLFPGSLGHINFVRPTYKNLEYCMYLWIIPSFGKQKDIQPITLKI